MNWLILFCCACFDVAAAVFIILGDKVTFPVNETCRKKGSELRHQQSGHVSVPVASWDGNEWKPGPEYQNRMSPGGSAVLNEANMNDQGSYELSCGPGKVQVIQVDIIRPSQVTVAEGDPVTLPFHHHTWGETVRSVTLERNGEPVLRLDFSTETDTPGPAFRGRASVRADWAKTGDLSLTVLHVQLQDGGDYIFYSGDEEGKKLKGAPAAVRLSVTKRTPETPCKEQQMPTICIILAGVIVVVALSAFACGTLECSRKCCTKVKDVCCRRCRVRDPENLSERDPALPESNGDNRVV